MKNDTRPRFLPPKVHGESKKTSTGFMLKLREKLAQALHKMTDLKVV